MPTIDTFKQELLSYLEPEQVDEVLRAYQHAKTAHEGQLRSSGEPYITHPFAVAQNSQ